MTNNDTIPNVTRLIGPGSGATVYPVRLVSAPRAFSQFRWQERLEIPNLADSHVVARECPEHVGI